MELHFVLVEHRFNRGIGCLGKTDIVEDGKQVHFLTGEPAAGKGLLSNQKTVERGPEYELVIGELDFDVADEFCLEQLSLRNPFSEDVEHFAHHPSSLVHGATLRSVLHHVLLNILHSLTEEGSSLLARHLLPTIGGLNFFHFLADIPHGVSHAFTHVTHAATAHERLHHRTAQVREVRLNLFATRPESVVVVLDEALDNRSLTVVQLELFDEERDIAAGEIWLEELADVPHSPHHSTTAAPTAASATLTASAAILLCRRGV